MKKFLVSNAIFVFSFFLIIGCQNRLPQQSQVNVSPAKPQQGQTFVISYIPGRQSPLAKTDSVFLEALLIPVNPTDREILEQAEMKELSMHKKGNRWQATLTPKQNTGCIVMQFKSNRKYDNNRDKGWDILLYSKDGVPVKGAYSALSQATGEGIVSFLMNLKKFNADSALLYYEKEIKLYPNNWRAKAVSINLRYRKAIKENTPRAINALKDEMDHFLNQHPNNLKLLELAYIFYYRPFPEKAKKVLEQIEKTDPKNRYVLGLKINRLKKIKDTRRRLEKLLNMQKMVAGTTSYFTWGNYTLEDLIALEKWNMVISLGEKMLKEIKSIRYIYPSYTRERANKWKQTRLYVPLKALALAYHKLGKNKIAENYYQQLAGLNVYPHQKVAFLEDYIRFLRDTDQLDKALKVALEAIEKANASPLIEKYYKEIYVEKTGNVQEAQKIIREAKKESGAWRKKELAQKMFANPRKAPSFSLKTLDGHTVSLSDLKGKIVIIDFWATWCNPCKASFPYLQKFWETHRNDSTIALFAVNTKERIKGQNRINAIKKFMDAHGYSFPVLLDDSKSSTMKAFNVGSIPTKFFIGPDGKIYFMEIGFHGPNMAEDMNIQVALIREKLRTLF